MAYAAALLAGLFLIWAAWAPWPLTSASLVVGAIGGALALALAARMIDREGAPYLRIAPVIMLRLSSLGRIIAGGVDMARRTLAADSKLQPALVRFRTRTGAGQSRAALANAIAAPGAVVVEADAESLLIHALIEDDADEEELRQIEARAWKVGG